MARGVTLEPHLLFCFVFSLCSFAELCKAQTLGNVSVSPQTFTGGDQITVSWKCVSRSLAVRIMLCRTIPWWYELEGLGGERCLTVQERNDDCAPLVMNTLRSLPAASDYMICIGFGNSVGSKDWRLHGCSRSLTVSDSQAAVSINAEKAFRPGAAVTISVICNGVDKVQLFYGLRNSTSNDTKYIISDGSDAEIELCNEHSGTCSSPPYDCSSSTWRSGSWRSPANVGTAKQAIVCVNDAREPRLSTLAKCVKDIDLLAEPKEDSESADTALLLAIGLSVGLFVVAAGVLAYVVSGFRGGTMSMKCFKQFCRCARKKDSYRVAPAQKATDTTPPQMKQVADAPNSLRDARDAKSKPALVDVKPKGHKAITGGQKASAIENGAVGDNADMLAVGTRVFVHGLVNARDINQKTGTCRSFDREAGRWTVLLDNNVGERKIKPENLCKL